jgi:hypothetical protein
MLGVAAKKAKKNWLKATAAGSPLDNCQPLAMTAHADETILANHNTKR